MENVNSTSPAVTGETGEKENRKAAGQKPSGKKKRGILRLFLRIMGVILLLLLAAAVTLAVILWGRIATAASVKEVDRDIYTVNYQQDYCLDKALEYGIKDQNDLVDFISKELFFGLADGSSVQPPHCSAFFTRTPEGEYIYCRNADMKGSTDAVIVYTHPGGGYASYSIVAPAALNVGRNYGFPTTSTTGRILLLAAPYLAMEGMNEKGLAVSVLSISAPERHPDTEKPDIMTNVSVRMLLDRAATIDEAVDMLAKYDNHSLQGEDNHLFISDASGRSVVVEWQNSVMNVIETDVCTNFELSSGVTENRCRRYDTIREQLADNPDPTADEAFAILKSACVYESVYTVWSTVYHPADFSIDIVYGRRFSDVHHLTRDDF